MSIEVSAKIQDAQAIVMERVKQYWERRKDPYGKNIKVEWIRQTGDPDWPGPRFEFIDMEYDNTKTPTVPLHPTSIHSAFFKNHGGKDVSDTFVVDQGTKASFSWSVTVGVKLGYKEKVDVTVPELGGMSVEESAELNFQTTATVSLDTTQRWSHSTGIVIPPHSKKKCSFIIDQGSFKTPWRGTLRVLPGGNLWIKFSNAPNSQYTTTDCLLHEDWPGYKAGDEYIYVSGDFEGNLAVSYTVEIGKDEPLDE